MNPRIPPSEIGGYYPKTYYTNEGWDQNAGRPSFRNRLKKALLVTRLKYPGPAPTGLPSIAGALLGRVFMKTPPMRRQIEWVPGGHVLDVGCGNGEILDQYRALGWRTSGIEPGPESAELARSKGHSIITGFVEEAGLPAESFNAITLWDALEHIPNPEVVLREIFRLLVPGGRVYIHVPNYGSQYARLWQDRWFMFTAPLHYFHYSAATLSALLARNGFSKISTSTGLGEVGWRQSVLSGAPKNAIRRRLLNSRPAIKLGALIEQGLPGGHLTAAATKPAVAEAVQ
jgi:2-polyprenyl-3-methyl-5-hydroxy-6-metoxy-1,4-benzoquinol methylase